MTPSTVSPDCLLLPMKRPEYYSVPEALLSSLAWRAYENISPEVPIGRGSKAPKSTASRKKQTGHMYEATPRSHSTLDLRATRPKGDDATNFGNSLKHVGGFSTDASDRLLGDAVASSILGIRIEKTGNQPASPLSPALALLQDPKGVLVKAGPPDFGDIIETIFALGHDAVPSLSATGMWLKSADKRMQIDPLLSSINASVMDSIFGDSVQLRQSQATVTSTDSWLGMFPNTPFAWFAESWTTLNSDDWVSALPSRVWVDWATALLRLGVGLGFLWEYSWYETIGSAIVGNAVPDSFDELVDSVSSPLPWRSSNCTISVRDVGSEIKWRMTRGEKVRKYLDKQLKEYKNSPELANIDAITFLNILSENKQELKKILADKTQAGKAVWETVKYGLQVREQSGPFTDYYGLLKTRNRNYLVVEPGTEWMAVVASLTCGAPGQRCNVGAVLRNLSRMGMRPEQTEVIEILERAGLARGSADADHAVIVESAF